jgi:hypothetical protein
LEDLLLQLSFPVLPPPLLRRSLQLPHQQPPQPLLLQLPKVPPLLKVPHLLKELPQQKEKLPLPPQHHQRELTTFTNKLTCTTINQEIRFTDIQFSRK